MLIDDYGLDSDFLKSSLDEEESSRVEQEENQTLIIVDTAVSEVQKDDTLIFYTMPLGIIITDHYVFTISLRENKVIDDVVSGRVRNIQTQFRTQFVLRLMMNITASFLVYLKQIDKTSSAMQRKLHGAMKNHELIQMLELEKSLIYFSTSLKSNDVTMNKILRGRVVKLYEEDQDLLEDVLIELKQAQEMASIYSGILSGGEYCYVASDHCDHYPGDSDDGVQLLRHEHPGSALCRTYMVSLCAVAGTDRTGGVYLAEI